MHPTSSFLRALIAAALIATALTMVVHASEPVGSDVPSSQDNLEALMAAPGLLSPADGAHTTGNPAEPVGDKLLYPPLGIPTFLWEDMGASKYELEIATTPAFGASVVLRRSSLQYASHTPTGFDELGSGLGLAEDAQHDFIDEATFFWRVRAWDDEQKQWGSFSVPRSFIRHWGYVPRLLEPENLSIQSGTPAFTWEPVAGASFYQIQIDTSSSFGSPSVNASTEVPYFIPTNSLQNDDDIFWRVRAFHRPNSGSFTGGRGGPWSEVRQFKLAWSSKASSWDTRPLQLTPPNNANYTYRPLFCWQPVPGAKTYSIDVATHPGFVTDSFVVKGAKTEGTCYVFNRDSTYKLEPDTTYYWRVTALDARGFPGQRTDEGTGSAAFSFRTAPSEPPTVPTMFYPPYYYPPVQPQNFEDRTVAVPTFVWDHVEGATSYQLVIDDDPAMAPPHVVVVETENASYTFTDINTYPLTDGQVYYWKVRSNLSPDFSALNTRWAFRVDRRSLSLSDQVKLIQPTYHAQSWTGGFRYGQESVSYYPVFAWTAVAPTGAAGYEIEIAGDEAFTNGVFRDQTSFTEYTPTTRPEPGTYFWRVRQVSPTEGPWSEYGRFIVSRNFTYAQPDGGPAGEWAVMASPAYSPTGEADDAPSLNLTSLHLVNDSSAWYFVVPLPAPDIKLGIYLDIDHFDHSGATSAPPGRPGPGVQPAHLPEYAVYWDGASGDSEVLKWTGTSWESLGSLSRIDGDAIYNAGAQLLEVKVPVTAINQPGSLSVLLFTYDSSSAIQDLLPNRPGQAQVAAFLTESTTPTPLFPANAPVDPALAVVERNTPVLTWRHHDSLQPQGVMATFLFETFQDDTFSNLYESEDGKAPNFTTSANWFWDASTFWAPQVHYSDNDSYNWRVQRSGFGPSAPHRFSKAGYVPTNLTVGPTLAVEGDVSYTDRTPWFRWEPAQSAVKYRWELYEGSVRRLHQDVMMPYYAPTDVIKDGTYTWKVWAIDARGRLSEEAAQGAFSRVSQAVLGLQVSVKASDLRVSWQPVDNAAYYKVLIASDDQFSRNMQSYSTTNSVFSPESVPKAARGGSFFIRVVTCDNNGNEGPYVDLYFQAPQVYLPVVLSDD